MREISWVIGDKGILAVGSGKEKVAEDTVAAMMTDDAEVISVYYGADASEEKGRGTRSYSGREISGL